MNDSLFTAFLFAILKVIFSDTSTSGIVMKNIPIRIAPSHIEPVIYIFYIVIYVYESKEPGIVMDVILSLMKQ